MLEEQKEALEVINKLNEQLYEDYYDINRNDYDDMPVFSVTMSNYITCITVNIQYEFTSVEIQLYNSEDSNRMYIKEIDDYEPLETYIKREFEMIQKNLKKFKL